MSKISDYFAKFEEQGQFRWSEDSEERDEIASSLLGAQIVSALDYWVKLATDLVANPEASRKFERQNALSREDKFYRDAFVQLTSQEKQTVINLVGKIASGVVFSTLVALDQFPNGELEISVMNSETKAKLATIAPQDIDLHNRFSEWLENFSENPQQYESDF